MTASILKQDLNTQKAQKNAGYLDETQHANFGGNPLYQSKHWTWKQHSSAQNR